MEGNWMWAVIVLPMIVAFLKKEIGEFVADYRSYKNRRWEDGDSCNALNGAKGEFGPIKIVDYKFGLFPSDRCIIIEHGGGREVVPYSRWRTFRLADIPKAVA